MLVQGVHAIANAAPATSGPPRPARRSSVSECHSRLSTRTNGVARNTTPIAMISAPPICSSACLCVFSERADHRRAEAQQDEDRREARDEQQARDEHPAHAHALLQVRRRDADHRREVAGHERQHAGREERHEPRGERERDAHAGGGVRGRGGESARVAHAAPRSALRAIAGAQLGHLALQPRHPLGELAPAAVRAVAASRGRRRAPGARSASSLGGVAAACAPSAPLAEQLAVALLLLPGPALAGARRARARSAARASRAPRPGRRTGASARRAA